MPSALNFSTGSSHQQMRMAHKAIAGDGRPLATLPWRQMAGPCLVLAECSAFDEFTLGMLSSDISPGHGTILLGRRPSASTLAQRAFAVAADAVSDPRKRLR